MVSQKITIWLVFAALVAGCILRLRFATFGLPYLPHADEVTNFNVLHAMIANADMNPHFFRYPSLMFYLNLPAQSVLAYFTGPIDPALRQTLGSGVLGQPSALLLARLTTLFFGAATILAGAALGRALAPATIAAPIAAWMIALDPLLVRHASFFTPDTIATFFVTMTLVGVAGIARWKTMRWFVIAGVFAGLAGSTKYNAGVVALAIPLALLATPLGLTRQTVNGLLFAIVAAIAAFFVASPYAILDATHALEGLLFELHHYKVGHAGVEGSSFRANTDWLIRESGWTLVLLPVLWGAQTRRRLLPVVAFVVIYFGLLASQNAYFERNLLLLLPALFVLVAIAAVELSKRLWRRPVHGMLGAAIVVALAWHAPVVLSANQFLSYKRDPRADARLWLENHVPASASIAVDAYTPYLQPRTRNIRSSNFLLNEPVDFFDNLDFVTFTLAGSGRYLGNTNSQQSDTFDTLSARACEIFHFPSPARAHITLLRLDCPPE